MGWAYFRERGFFKIRPSPSLSSHLSSSPMGIFSRAYGIIESVDSTCRDSTDTQLQYKKL